MKKYLFLFCFLAVVGFSVQAGERYEFVDSVPSKRTTLPPIVDLRRPHAPARVFITCEYGLGYLSVTLPSGVYYATIQLFNGSFEWTGLATTEQPLVELPDDLAGEYTIICRTDDGRVFSGTLEF